MSTLELEIDGMSCSHCVASVTQALRELPGVEVKNVGIGTAQVTYEAAKVSPEDIVLAVEDAGYMAQMKASS
jgi:copper chaperone CopZ